MVDRFQRLLIEGLQACEPHMNGKSTKEELLFISCGGRKESPFPDSVVEDTREKLRLAFLPQGLDSGLPREGDVVQAFEVRLIQALAVACDYPESVFCDFWARGVWIGQATRRLPRTPAIFERKTSWLLGTMEEHHHC